MTLLLGSKLVSTGLAALRGAQLWGPSCGPCLLHAYVEKQGGAYVAVGSPLKGVVAMYIHMPKQLVAPTWVTLVMDACGAAAVTERGLDGPTKARLS